MCMIKRKHSLYAQVQSNQKMHDLYATMHIFQMALPDAFWAVYRVKFFHNIKGKFRFLRYCEKI